MRRTTFITYSILMSRIVYSLYWVFLSPAYTLIGLSLGVSYANFGLISWSFVIGAGIFQIPAGLVASKVNPQRVYMLGLAVLASSSFITALSGSFFLLLISRFIGGVGAAFFFASAGYVIAAINRKRVGLYMGVYNSAFSIGAGVGFAWASIYRIMYWRTAVMLAGLMGLIMVVLDYTSWYGVPSGIVERVNISDIRKTSLKLDVIMLALVTSGFWGTYYAAETLLPAYFMDVKHFSLISSSYLSSILLLAGIPGGFANMIYDRVEHRELLVFLTGLTAAVGFFSLDLGLIGSIIGLAIVGFSNGLCFSSLYALTTEYAGFKNGTMVLATVNSVNMFIGVWIAPLFSTMQGSALTLLWPTMASLTVLPMIPLIVRKSRQSFFS